MIPRKGMAKMQQNTAAHEPSRQICGNVIFYLGQKREKKKIALDLGTSFTF